MSYQDNPNSGKIESLLKHAESKWDKDDYQEAIKIYNKILEINPHDIWSYWERALIKKKKGDWEGAFKDLNRLLEINASHSFAYYQRAVIKEHFKDKRGAESDYAKASEYREKEMKIFKEQQTKRLQMSSKRNHPEVE
ncbi:MAG: DUF3808 domain-containing protein [Candidatus Aureabacteria bacterium]|nr:DUF3808 domain-containing protein [Candidatus Auribacterota bacterium]